MSAAPVPPADAAELGFDPARLERLRGWMARYVEAGRIPGAHTLIARHGRIAWHGWEGMRDVEAGLPWERDTLVRIYSMTKPLTAVLLMTLYEEGRLSLDDPLDTFLPEFAGLTVLRPGAASIDEVEPLAERPTLRHLLTHTAGFTYGFQEGLLAQAYREAGVDFSTHDTNLAGMVARLARLPLGFQPGTRWHYSVASDVLGRVIEVVTGQPLDRVFAERLLAPLGMEDTFFAVPADRLARLAALYAKTEDDPMARMEGAADSRFAEGQVRLFSGGGGLVSTAEDFLRFAEMLRRGGSFDGTRILGPRTVRFMATNHLPGDLASMGQRVWAEVSFEGIGFGLMGWVMLEPARAGMLGSPGDFGWGGMASTVHWIDPVEDMVVIFMTQLAPSSSWPLRKELRALVYSALVD